MFRRIDRLGPAALLLLAAGCNPAPRDAPATAEAEESGTPEALDPVTRLSAIKGEWTIVSLGNFTVDLASGIALDSAQVTFTEEGVGYRIGCNSSGNPVRLGADGVLRDTSGTQGRLSTLILCPTEQAARDGQLFAFFASSPRVLRSGDDRLVLIAGATRLVLERPERRRLAFRPPPAQLYGRWVPIMTRVVSSGGYTGDGFGEAPSILTIAPGSLNWSRCPQATVAATYNPATGRLDPDGTPPPGCFDRPAPGYDAPHTAERVMRSAPVATLAPRGGLELRTQDGLVLFLQREEEWQRERAQTAPPVPRRAPAEPPPPPAPPPPAPRP